MSAGSACIIHAVSLSRLYRMCAASTPWKWVETRRKLSVELWKCVALLLRFTVINDRLFQEEMRSSFPLSLSVHLSLSQPPSGLAPLVIIFFALCLLSLKPSTTTMHAPTQPGLHLDPSQHRVYSERAAPLKFMTAPPLLFLLLQAGEERWRCLWALLRGVEAADKAEGKVVEERGGCCVHLKMAFVENWGGWGEQVRRQTEKPKEKMKW